MIATINPATGETLQEFPVLSAESIEKKLALSWTREQGQGGSGRGCQVSEVWLINTKEQGGA